MYHQIVRDAAARWNVKYVTDARFNLRMAASGRIDLTVADIPWAQVHSEHEGLNLKVLSPVLFATPQYVFFHPGRAAVGTGLDNALRDLLADGTVDRLYERTIGTSFQMVQKRVAGALTAD